MRALCAAFAARPPSAPADLNYAFRCMTMDVITYLCFGTSIAATQTPDFAAPILLAMDASTAVFVRFKHSALYKTMITACPPALAVVLSPATKGMIGLQTLLRAQIRGLLKDPQRGLEGLPHDMTIYHRLMDPGARREGGGGGGEAPSEGSLYEEAQALMFGGADTVGNALMVGSFHLLRQPRACARLKRELGDAWPAVDGEKGPGAKELAELPYLDAVIKEALRMSSGVVAGLLRVVPKEGAVVAGTSVPGGVSAFFFFGRRVESVYGFFLTLRSCRPSSRVPASSCTSTPTSSLNPVLSARSAGSRIRILTTGSWLSRGVHGCAWVSSKYHLLSSTH